MYSLSLKYILVSGNANFVRNFFEKLCGEFDLDLVPMPPLYLFGQASLASCTMWKHMLQLKNCSIY